MSRPETKDITFKVPGFCNEQEKERHNVRELDTIDQMAFLAKGMAE